MRYPVLTRSQTTELSASMLQEPGISVDAEVQWANAHETEEVDLTRVAELAEEIERERIAWADSDRDRFEGRKALALFDALSEVPFEVLDDPGFWRYLSLRYFWDFIQWRESGPFSKGNHLRYVDAVSSTESVLTRMYLRALALAGEDDDHLADIENATDFWRSHVFRVRTVMAPPLARAFAAMQKTDRLPSAPLRSMARRLNRTWTNTVIDLYDDDEARGLIAEVRLVDDD